MGLVSSHRLHAIARIFLVAACCVALPMSALAQPRVARTPKINALSTLERETLVQGGVVTRPLKFRAQGGEYVGGVAYVVVHAPPEVVLACLSDVGSWPEFLPHTRSAVLVKAQAGRAWVELMQGNALASGKYTIALLRSPRGDEFRFWRDMTQPGDIQDVWGFFRVRPFTANSSLVAVGAAVDLGPGLVRWLFEDAVQRLVLATPHHLRAYVEPRALARFP